MSVDGFVGGPHGEMDWLTQGWDDELKNTVTKLMEPVDCIVMGRKIAQGFIPHWAAHPELEGADKINSAHKIVFSKTLTTSEWPNTDLATGDLTEEINQLKAQPGGELIAFGGANFVSGLIAAGLIDELNLFVNPVALGKGVSIFNGLDAMQKFEFKQLTAFPCGVVLLRYEPKR